MKNIFIIMILVILISSLPLYSIEKADEKELFLEVIRKTEKFNKTGILPKFYIYKNFLYGLIIAHEEAGLSLFETEIKKSETMKNRDDLFVHSRDIALILKDNNREKLIEFGLKTKNKIVNFNFTRLLSITTLKDFDKIAELINLKEAEGSFVSLIAALELRKSSAKWREIFHRAEFATNTPVEDGDIAVAHEFLKYFIDDNGRDFAKLILKLEDEKSFPVVYLSLIDILETLIFRFGKDGNETISFVEMLVNSTKNLTVKKEIEVLGNLSILFRDKIPLKIYKRLKNIMKEELFTGKIDHGLFSGSFYFLLGNIKYDEELSMKIGEWIINGIFELKNSEKYYHMVSTVCGALAVKFPQKVLESSKRIKSLEWYIHSQRSIFRGWAMSEPGKAKIAAEKFEIDYPELKERLRKDLLLEVAVGASLKKPEFAVEILDKLPDSEIRKNQGDYLIAPVIAKKDLDLALNLLNRKNTVICGGLTLALAQILIDGKGKIYSPMDEDFFPERVLPIRTVWPGPYLPFPLRFK